MFIPNSLMLVPILPRPGEQSQSLDTDKVRHPIKPIKGRAKRIQLFPLCFTKNLLVNHGAIHAGTDLEPVGILVHRHF